MNILVVCSTGGSVLSKVLDYSYIKERVKVIVTDRECGVIDVAKAHNINCIKIPSDSGSEFSAKLCNAVQLEKYDLLISFYTRLFSGNVLQIMKDRMINLHPSILPACPGLNGFEDTINSGSCFIGATIHFVDEGMDSGLPIIQSAVPFNPSKSIEENRHRVFIDQCRMLIQTVRWFEDKRVIIHEGKVLIENAEYKPDQYSPNLDWDLAKEFNVKLSK